MPIYIRKGPLEIPPGSEKDWASEEHEDYFLRDPDQSRDSLPQPYRMIAKVVECLIDQAIELIKIREQSREEEKLKKKSDILQPAAEIHVSRRVNCVAAGANGSFLFVGLSEGLMVYSLSGGDWICGWEAEKLEVCSLSICHVKNHTYLVGTVDDMGIARLFYFSEENLHFVKAINETEDISKRTVCITFKLSHGGDYAGVLLEGFGECWLEVYRLPKDSWLKELDHAHTTGASTPIISTESAGTHLSEPKITQPVLLMKIRPPKPITGSTFKSVQEAVQKSDDSSVFGTGQNHVISSHQWEQQEAIFMGMYEKYLSIDVPKIPEGETSRHTMFHILQPNKILHNDSETMQSAVPNAISVHWSGCHNFFIYQLAKSMKDKADVDPKADIVWPCSAPITFSAVSSCTSYLALALENETLAVWDLKYSGFPLAVVALPEGRHIGSLYHLEHNACSKEPPATTRAQILVWCTDKSLYLVTAARGREHGTVILLRESTGPSDNQISAVSPIHSLPSMVLLHYWNSTVELFDVSRCEPVCQFGLPSTHMLASPWQPVYSLDTENLSLFLKGTEKVTPGETLSAENDGCSVFVFSLNTLIKTPKPVGDLSQNLPWEQKCKLLLQSRLQTLPERRKQIAESWSLLRKQASDLMHRDTLSR